MPDRGCGLYTLLALALIFLTGGMIIPIVLVAFFLYAIFSK